MSDHQDTPQSEQPELPHPHNSTLHADDGVLSQSQVIIQPQVISGQVTNAGTIHGPVVGVNTGTIIYQAGVPLTETLKQLLYHHESATIFANRLQGFVGREAELVEIRQRIAQVMPMGGYVTITAQAGEGKSSVIAQMVSQDGPDQTAFHFIALTPGREYQLSLLRPIVARLILKHGLPTTYFPGESYPAMRDYFHSVLRQLSERGLQEVIYIDGLDQLEADVSGTRDLSFLPISPPLGIVIVLGTRPDDTLQPLEGKKVQVEYRLPHLSYQDFQALLMQRGVSTPVAQRLYTALQGNAFYLALVVQELKAGPIPDLDAFIQRISDNPDNLFGLTIERLQGDADQWEKVLERVLGLLLVAQEPLDRATIRSLLGVSDVRLRRGLGQLGGLVAQNAEGRYFLYHLKVREYLAEDLRQPDKDFVVSHDQIVTWHRNLAIWCVQDTTDIERIWEDSTGLEQNRRWYARHHYITHLALGEQWKTLWQVIDDGRYGRHKRRFDPSTHLYAQDLDRARDVALQTDDLIYLWRSSLLYVNLASRVEQWFPSLFLALIHMGRENEALSRIELISNPVHKVSLWCAIVPFCMPNMVPLIWERARNTAETIIHSEQRVAAMCILGEALAQSRHPDATVTLNIARTSVGDITNPTLKVAALRSLTIALGLLGQVETARSTAEIVTNDKERTRLLILLSNTLVQTGELDQALVIIESITNDTYRAAALRSVSEVLAQAGQWTPARTIADTISNTGVRIITLCNLAAKLIQADHPEAHITLRMAITTYYAAIETITDDNLRVYVLIIVATLMTISGHPDAEVILSAYHNTVDQLADPRRRDKILKVVVKGLVQIEQWDVAHTIAKDITNVKRRGEALMCLAAALTQSKRWDVARIVAENITNVAQRREALSHLSEALARVGHPHTSAVFTAACTTIENITNTNEWRESVSLLATVLAHTDQWQAVHIAATMISNDTERGKVLRTLATTQVNAKDWQSARTTVEAISNKRERTEALCSLATALIQTRHVDTNDVFMDARAVAYAITDGRERAAALCSLATALIHTDHMDTNDVFTDARAAADAIIDERERAAALCALVKPLIDAKQWNAARTMALTISDQHKRAETLRILTEAMSQNGEWEDARRIANIISVEDEKTWALGAIAEALTQNGQLETARRIIDSISAPRGHDYGLRILATTLAQGRQWALARLTADAITNEREREDALSDIAEALTQNKQWDAARTIIDAIINVHKKAFPLRILATALAQTGIWDAATSIAQEITDDYQRSVALYAIVEVLSQAREWKNARIAADTIKDERWRGNALQLLAIALAQAGHPDAIGTFNAARTIAEAITDTQKRAEAFTTLYTNLIAAGQHSYARSSIAMTWYKAKTYREVLPMTKVAMPLISLDPALGVAMVDAMVWVDIQLQGD